MKKKNWNLPVATIAYSYLFYSQTAGVNYLLFTVLLIALLTFQKERREMLNRNWLITAFACLISAFSVVVVNSGLSILANVISLALLAVFSTAPSASIFYAALYAIWSLIAAPVKALMVSKDSTQEQQLATLSFVPTSKHRISVVGLPLVIFFLFLWLYKNSSMGFEHVLSFINFDFISWPWVWFTLFGAWLLVCFFRPLILTKLAKVDELAPNHLSRVKKYAQRVFNTMALKNELKTGVLLLALLNGLLFVFILSDAYYLFIGDLPEGIPYSEYLHQGVYTLIFTILLAIAILLYLFRENLNFYSKNQSLKKLAYVWLGLNMVLVLLTLTKNSIYITGTGLTYKRIGVYTYLILTGIGLIFSYIKVSKVKTNWYLFRMNGWAVYVLLVVFSTVNWDRVLTRFNLTYAKSPDLAYLFTLSNSNLSLLKEDIALSRHAFTDNQKKSLAEWELEYLRGEAQKEWQSWNYNDWRLSNELR